MKSHTSHKDKENFGFIFHFKSNRGKISDQTFW